MKKRILFVISRMSIGGSQRSLVNALNVLDVEKYDVTLYVRENKTELIPEINGAVRVIVNEYPTDYERSPVSLAREALKRILLVFKAKKAAARTEEKAREYVVVKKTEYEKRAHPELSEGYDVAVSYLQGYTCRFTADVVKAERMICFYHNSTDGTPGLHAEYLPKFDRIVTVAAETREMLASKYPSIAGKLTSIQNIIDTTGIKKKAGGFDVPHAEGKTVLCTCGRISPEKGYELAVEAARKLAADGVPFKWFFIGDGPKDDEIKKQISDSGLEDRIELLGSKSNPYPWIKACDIYVQPSYEESQSLTIMEAQILRRPVVSTATVGARGNLIDGKNGLLADFTGEAIAQGIERLIDDPGLVRSFSEELKSRGFEEYNTRIKKQWVDLLEGKDEE